MKRKTKQTSAPNTYGNPVITHEQVKSEFVKTVGNPKAGDNNFCSSFIRVMDALQNMKGSWSLSDAVYLAKPFNIPPMEVKRLFQIYVDTLLHCRRVEEIDGCYEEKVYIMV
jgi:hypothetical protein